MDKILSYGRLALLSAWLLPVSGALQWMMDNNFTDQEELTSWEVFMRISTSPL